MTHAYNDMNPGSPRDAATYDVVLFGATSYVGRIVAGYLARTYPPGSGVRIALAGRNLEVLTGLKESLGVDFPIVLADITDSASVESMVASTTVLISTVGPYSRYGDVVVEACARRGTDYVDLCGEAFFIRRTIDAYHEIARQSGSRIVHACGFDSVPSDIGMLNLSLKAGEEFSRVFMVVERMRGGFSGGTIASMREGLVAARRDPELARQLLDPYSLCPSPQSEATIAGLENDFVFEEVQVGPVHTWVGPFFMSSFNTRIVRRSNSLLDHAYGKAVAYKEAIATGQGALGKTKARTLLAATRIGFAAIQQPRLKKPLSLILPEPGEGPSEKERAEGYFQITHVGETLSGKVVTGRVQAEGDPGYEVTAMMLAEAALALVESRRALNAHKAVAGGVLTPATALGTAYMQRLREHGMLIG
ncbi:saccharopine dehydrogenase family protein [Corynebacterium vitaeruminis]|uniref:saccharopine dehydrogenase family protein n=1 Tax=Corynebacterium vitaeruminis TaxID=38305 RepID=UPI0023F304C4|nr:saccharopine dehydrogenase NADP-binding domain-containing protein [Corynebacterium vitaeruminis]